MSGPWAVYQTDIAGFVPEPGAWAFGLIAGGAALNLVARERRTGRFAVPTLLPSALPDGPYKRKRSSGRGYGVAARPLSGRKFCHCRATDARRNQARRFFGNIPRGNAGND